MMKIKNAQAVTLLAAFMIITSVCAKDAENFDMQLTPPTGKREMVEPITFSADGVHAFIKQTYNNSEYGRDFLPNSFDHLLQFLDHGKKTQQSAAYVKSVVRLFTHKLKGSAYVNAYAFSDMLSTVGDLLDHHLAAPKNVSLAHVQTAINDMMFNRFLNNYNQFKVDPKLFLNDLSADVTRMVAHDQLVIEEHVTTEQLRQTFIRFLEVGLNKLIWNPNDHQDLWQSVTTIARQLNKLQDRGLVNDLDDLDAMYWSLVHRFSYFIEMANADLPVAFYEHVKNEIANTSLDLFMLEEQEQFMMTKAEHLTHILAEGEAKARAKQFGIITLS